MPCGILSLGVSDISQRHPLPRWMVPLSPSNKSPPKPGDLKQAARGIIGQEFDRDSLFLLYDDWDLSWEIRRLG